MKDRTSRIIIVFGSFLTGLVLCLGLIFFVVQTQSGTSNLQAASIGGPFQLIDQDGRTVTDRDFKGKPFLVFFGFTHCPDVCPTTLFDISEVMRALGKDADKTAALFVTVDPERDSPAILHDYLANFDPHVRGLTGDATTITSVLKTYRVYAKKVPLADGDYTMDHTAIVYLMDKNGNFVSAFNLKQKPEISAENIRKYL